MAATEAITKAIAIPNMSGVGQGINTFIQALFWIGLGLALIIFLWWVFRFNIRVPFWRMVHGTPVYDEDKAIMKLGKRKGIAKFQLRKSKVDLGSLINKTDWFIPSKRFLFGYTDSIMLVCDGNPQEIDSWKVIKPDEFTKFVIGDQNLSKDRISGIAKLEWLQQQKGILEEFSDQPWYTKPWVGLIIQGIGIGAIVIILILGNSVIQEILQKAGSANVLTQETLVTIKESLNIIKATCGTTGTTPAPPP